jgi:hypothetical protein
MNNKTLKKREIKEKRKKKDLYCSFVTLPPLSLSTLLKVIVRVFLVLIDHIK